ncbi:MAG: 1,4-alpha-glucan branching protein GlgB, partial [Candidatus Omnitrophica bacterium]|nr:1,4-alpha-glucan branching protein GlgB [Candidatus Omnitrophota bacterium]
MPTDTIVHRREKKPARPVSRKEVKKVVREAQEYLKEIKPVNCYLSDFDVHLIREGNHFNLYDKLGAHVVERDGIKGVWFAVWAPNASVVSVIGDFNGWNRQATPLTCRGDHSGVWEGFVANIGHGQHYKFYIRTRQGWELEKSDPMGFHSELPPKSASIVWDLAYQWRDQEWMAKRKTNNALNQPISVYEVHLGSWMRVPEEGSRSLTYVEMADKLVAYVKKMGYTHVEFMPVLAHPFQGSWGYQTVGFFAPASFFGNPQELMFLIDKMHQNDIGVFIDWVPSHFPNDGHGLYQFDGTSLYEHEDQRKGFHPDWKSSIFNYGRVEVRNYLISSALFWLDKYHADGLRVDGVASMLYLDYSRKEGEWIPNCFGGRENLEAIDFIKRLNEAVYAAHPDIQMTAEESTAWTKVSKPTFDGGLGFGMKWNMGWMHDTLVYFSKDPVYRKHHHGQLTFGLLYAFTENFMMSLSHDEVVHGKGALLNKMPGDDWQKFANLRLLFGYMFGQPGKKLHFMGGEIGQWDEWNYQTSLDWHLLNWQPHQGVQRWMQDLNATYRREPALYADDFTHNGFEWIECGAWEDCVLTWVRKSSNRNEDILCVCNFTPVMRDNYLVGVPQEGYWREILNSDADIYWGSNKGNAGGVMSSPLAWNGRQHSVSLRLPPLSVMFFKIA